MAGDFKHLVGGRRYVVRQAFADYDGGRHEIGETWTFSHHDFLPYDDGLTLWIDPGVAIRLQWTPQSQGPIIDNLEAYIEAV